MLGSELKWLLVIWGGLLAAWLIGWSVIGRLTGTQDHAVWAHLGAVVLVTMFAMVVAAGPVRRWRQWQVLQTVLVLLENGRHANALEEIARARLLWPAWHGIAIYAGTAQLALWRVDAARASFAEAVKVSAGPQLERRIFSLALLAAELAGEADEIRKRVQRARIPEASLLLPNAVRAMKEEEFPLAQSLLSDERLRASAGTFLPLVDVLLAWAMESSQPGVIDKVRFLSETGLEQVERVWPALADFVRRAKACS